VVKGIAKDPDGQMLAVVEGGAAHRAYFLRENDQVFNGNVEKITSDSVVFREFATDNLGRESAHEVVKKIPKS
jgi:type II secretory pathway component PulC